MAEKTNPPERTLKGETMANITLNIEGDLNIFLDGRDDAPCRMYLDDGDDTV